MNLTRLSSADLQQLYDSLHAETVPVGTFNGTTWPISVSWIWQGKVFSREFPFVWNRMFGGHYVEGNVSLHHSEVVIDYPQLGIRDTLKPVSSTQWLGQAHLWFGLKVWFSLEAKP